MKMSILLQCDWYVLKPRYGATLILLMLHIMWCTSVVTLLPVWRLTGCLRCAQWLMDTHNLSSLLGTDSLGLNQKCHLHYKEGYSPLGRRSERKITQPHTAGIRTNMLFKWQQSAGLSPTSREMGERKKKTATCDIDKGQENRCLSNLLLNGVRLQIVHSPFHPISRFVTHNF